MALGPIEDEIAAHLGSPVVQTAVQHGGCVGEVYRAALADGREVIAKVDRRDSATLATEGWMLGYLARHSALPVPKVLHNEPALLIMEFLQGDSHYSANAERHAAELLAALHAIRGERFGLERSTLIGALPLPNPLSVSWVEFFREHRLLNFARAARTEGCISGALLKRIEALGARLGDLIDEPEYPALLHGDVWSGNVLATQTRITGFIDPAIYYGHPEIELAFIRLFSTFGRAFFERYQELHPIQAGFFETRCALYNLYPLLVHTRLFGGGYAASVERTIVELGF